MKTLFTTLAFAALALQPALADWVIVQKSATDGQTQEMILKVKGEKARSDVGTQMSMILDGTGSNIILLMHPQKAMMKMSGDSLKSMMALASSALGGGDKGAPAKPQPTGEKEKVGQYDTEIYTWSGKIGSGKFWVAKDFPQAKELNAVQDKLTKAMGDPTAAFMPSAADFPGMIVKSEVKIMGKTITSETVSAKEEPVDDAIFILPADYKEMKMPTLPGGK
ncbi:MAG: DUF4412 domain-containing protein [Prosthecobacter sp.]|nr:DUF4412 domain-containing protein [Prosthecobacter sp.]